MHGGGRRFDRALALGFRGEWAVQKQFLLAKVERVGAIMGVPELDANPSSWSWKSHPTHCSSYGSALRRPREMGVELQLATPG